MLLWKTSLDPYISIIPSDSPAILPMVLKLPHHSASCHVVIYLPTSGQEAEFVAALASLDSCLNDIYLKYEECPIFIRGDANVNPNNASRASLFRHFLDKHNLLSLDLHHPTYHHFLGNGAFDSALDVILYKNLPSVSEDIISVLCKLDHPLINSHHDIVLSSFSLPPKIVSTEAEDLILAPKIPNTRTKIIWDKEGISNYERLVGDNLTRLRDSWCDPDSPASMSILLSSTYSILSSAAAATNHTINLGVSKKIKSRQHPEIKSLQKSLLAAQRTFAKLSTSPSPDYDSVLESKQTLTEARATLRRRIRQEQKQDDIARDEKISSCLVENPTALFRSIKSFKSSGSTTINKLHVNGKTYIGDQVPDGFFDSLNSLKAPDLTPIHSTPQFRDTLLDFENIIKICRHGQNIPEISPKQSTEILLSLRADVNDFYSITANHFINAGRAGFTHFHFLLSSLAKNVNLASLDELNTVWACILHKGHGKDKEVDRSYRTISTCPLLAKALDTYIGQLYGAGWEEAQASTQFQGPGSSHELASLLLTETVQYSLYNAKLPIFVLLLDAKSAFDKVVHECAVRNAYLAGSSDQGLIYINSRLKHRKTCLEYNKVIMGPIDDTIGVEQGGVNSDRLYKLCNNVQLSTAQESGLGVEMGEVVVSSIGQADDTALVSNCLLKLAGLLQLAVEYCQKYHVELVPEKTKLLAFSPTGQKSTLHLQKLLNPLSLNGHRISFSTLAEHVGVLRSVEGNMPSVMARISAHNRAVMAVLPAGMARGHNGNPAASLRLERLYGCPVLLSGLASLVLNKSEIGALHHHHKINQQKITKLHQGTPESVVMFLAGSLPATALLHLRMLGLLGMIARLGPSNILHEHGRHILLSVNTGRSWFLTIRDVCLQYGLLDPLLILQSPPSKLSWKNLTKSKVVDWWEIKLRGEIEFLDSLKYFHASYMNLTTPHPLWSSAGSPYEVRKAVIAARMVSGRYRTDRLARHWSKSNPSGFCQLPACTGEQDGTLEHLLLHCPALSEARSRVIKLWSNYMVSHQYLFPVVSCLTLWSEQMHMQLLLDPSCIPAVIAANKSNSAILPGCLYLSRTWVYTIHLTRMKLKKLWNLT